MSIVEAFALWSFIMCSICAYALWKKKDGRKFKFRWKKK